jgi:hypothetical protein
MARRVVFETMSGQSEVEKAINEDMLKRKSTCWGWE